MAITVDDLLGDSLFQVNLLLWMLQSPNGSNIRPLLGESGYTLKSIEQVLPLSPALTARLAKAGIAAKDSASPDMLVAADDLDHLIVECKAKMFGGTPTEGGKDDHHRQARSFLLQTPDHLSSALAGSKVAKSSLAYLTKYDSKHDQSKGLLEVARGLKAAKLPAISCCVWKLMEHDGGVGLLMPQAGELWPKRIADTCKKTKRKKVVNIIPRDPNGNDLRPLYFIPWMPDSEPQVNEYNRRAFGNRILSAAVVRIGRTAVDQDVTLNYEDLLDEVTLGVFKKWRNREAKKSLLHCVRKMLGEHLKKTSAITSDPDGTGSSLLVKVCEEKIKAAVIKSFRETIDTKWDQPDPQTELPFDKSQTETGVE